MAIELHLFQRDSVLWVIISGWIQSGLNFWVCCKHVSNFACRLAVPTHAEVERLDASKHEIGVERAEDRSDGVLVESKLRCNVSIAGCENARDDIAVASKAHAASSKPSASSRLLSRSAALNRS